MGGPASFESHFTADDESSGLPTQTWTWGYVAVTPQPHDLASLPKEFCLDVWASVPETGESGKLESECLDMTVAVEPGNA